MQGNRFSHMSRYALYSQRSAGISAGMRPVRWCRKQITSDSPRRRDPLCCAAGTRLGNAGGGGRFPATAAGNF